MIPRTFALIAMLVCLLAAPAFAAEIPVEAEAVALLSQYLKLDTVNPPGNEIRGAEFFKAILEREGIPAQIFESAPGRGSVCARLKGDGSRKAIILLNHMDVVPADPRHWSVDPLSGAVKEGNIYGRGALDMKSMGIVELLAMLALKRQGVPLAADVIFLGTADEEAGGKMGAGFMVREHFDLFKDAGLLINEGSRISIAEDGKVRYYGICPVEKTPFWLKLTASGTPGHGSAPRADSAVGRLLEALHRLRAWQTPITVEPVVQKFYAATADLEPDPARREKLKDLRAALSDPAFAKAFTADHRDNALVRNTISINMLEGSGKVNVIPAEASAHVDIRLLPSQDPEKFLAELRKIIADDTIKIEVLLSFPPTESPGDGEFFKVLRQVADQFDPGARFACPLLAGFTDSHYFREKGIPSYGFQPFRVSDKESDGVHGNNERISVDNLQNGAKMMVEIVKKLAAR